MADDYDFAEAYFVCYFTVFFYCGAGFGFFELVFIVDYLAAGLVIVFGLGAGATFFGFATGSGVGTGADVYSTSESTATAAYKFPYAF